MITACRQRILLPGVFGGVDAVIGRQHPGAMVHGNTEQTNGFGPADKSPQILDHQEVELRGPEHRLDFSKLRAVETLAFACCGDHPEINGPIVNLVDCVLGMVLLVVEAHLFLVLATADSGHNADNQLMPVTGHGCINIPLFHGQCSQTG